MNDSGYALGIDVGTTYTAAATWRDGLAETVPLGDRAHTVPSVVLLEDDGELVVGEAAAGRAATEPNRVTRGFKRSFGDDDAILLSGREFTAVELTGRLLHQVLAKATDAEGAPPSQVAVTVPATWQGYRTGLMSQLLTETLEQFGLPGVAASALVIPEPAAAAVHYAAKRALPPGTGVGVYDLGGGTFDATVLLKTTGGFEIAGRPVGADDLGGTDLDHTLLGRAGSMLGPQFAALDRRDPQVRTGLILLRQSLVEAKEALSGSWIATVPVLLPGLPPSFRLTREQLEADAAPLVARTIDVFRNAVELSGLTLADLNAVLLVGGSSRIPLVGRTVQEQLGIPVAVDAHPKYAVCLGAAISAGARLDSAPRHPSFPPDDIPRHPGHVPDDIPRRPGHVPEDPHLWPTPSPSPSASPDSSDAGRFAEMPELPAFSAETSVAVDLHASGLTGADDVPLRPAVELRRRLRAEPVAAPLTIDLGQDAEYLAGSRRTALRALALTTAVVVAAAVAVLILNALH